MKEQLRRSERKNRDAFRKLMEEHSAEGTLNAKTLWRDYCLKVRAYIQIWDYLHFFFFPPIGTAFSLTE